MAALFLLERFVSGLWICPTLPNGRAVVQFWTCFHWFLP
jgi:hypothetical protein